jgi:hypothetical protein
LFDYPWIYIVHPEGLELRDGEVPILRNYLLNGGVLMTDDCWGAPQWESFVRQMKRVLPDRSWVELPMEHPIFHCVFNLKGPKNNLQVPTMQVWERFRDREGNVRDITWHGGEGARDVHVRAWLDDRQRIMVISMHNTDNGDGWEREGEDPEYFQTFSEPRAYPLAINVLFYLMTH